MFYLIRLLVILAVLVGLGYGALYALGALVEPERREIVIILPNPNPKPRP
jgi:hypothetical protein